MEQIKIDIVPVGVAPVAHASQFDNGRQIRFNLFNQGTPYTLTGAETVTMVVNGEEENITNTSDNYVIWDVAEEDCEEVGVIGCEIRIVLGSMLIGSKNFFLEVEMDPYDGKNIRTITVGPADICTFETTLPEPLQSVIVDVEATGGNGTPDNPNPIVGYTEANIVNTQNESIADLFSIDSDFRGTVVFNQLIGNNLRASQTQGGVTYTNNGDGSFTLNGTATQDDYWVCAPYPNNILTVGHKYLLWDANNAGVANQYGIGWRNAPSVILVNPTIINCSDASDAFIYIYKNGAIINNVTFRPQLIDLTAMFGSTIADYIYTLEQNNAGAGVDFFRSIYPADYYDYDSGTTEIVGKETPEATIAFGQAVYGGVLDVTRGKLHVTHISIDNLKNETWSYNSGLKAFIFYLNGYKTPSSKLDIMNNLCETYQTKNAGAFDNLSDDLFFAVGLPDYYNGRVLFRNLAYTDVDTFKATLEDVKLVYELATPFDIDLTPEVISAFVGTNNVFADCGQTTVKYLKAGV